MWDPIKLIISAVLLQPARGRMIDAHGASRLKSAQGIIGLQSD